MKKKHQRSLKIIHLFNEQSGACIYCDTAMTLDLGYDHTATVDHIVPKALGGKKEAFNEVAACHKCNNLKGSIPISKWFLILQEKRNEERSRQENINSPADIPKIGYWIAGYREGAHPD